MKNTVILEYSFEFDIALDILGVYGIDYMTKDEYIYVNDDGLEVLRDNNFSITVLENYMKGENDIDGKKKEI